MAKLPTVYRYQGLQSCSRGVNIRQTQGQLQDSACYGHRQVTDRDLCKNNDDGRQPSPAPPLWKGTINAKGASRFQSRFELSDKDGSGQGSLRFAGGRTRCHSRRDGVSSKQNISMPEKSFSMRHF